MIRESKYRITSGYLLAFLFIAFTFLQSSSNASPSDDGQQYISKAAKDIPFSHIIKANKHKVHFPVNKPLLTITHQIGAVRAKYIRVAKLVLPPVYVTGNSILRRICVLIE